MGFLKESADLILPLIAMLAAAILLCPKPSISALFLFIQSVLISIYLALSYGGLPAALGTSVLLSFFSMILIGNNIYFEASFKRAFTRLPKATIALGLILMAVFLKNLNWLVTSYADHDGIGDMLVDQSGLFMIIAGFSLFAMLVAALSLFDLKNSKPGE